MLKIRIPKRKLLSITSNYNEKLIISHPIPGYDVITIKDLRASSVYSVLEALKIPLNVYEKDAIRVVAKDTLSSTTAYSNQRRQFIPTVFTPTGFVHYTYSEIIKELDKKPKFKKHPYYYITRFEDVSKYISKHPFMLSSKSSNIILSDNTFICYTSNPHEPDQYGDLGWNAKKISSLDEVSLMSDTFTFSYTYFDADKIPGDQDDSVHLVHNKNKVRVFKDYTKKFVIKNLRVAQLNDYAKAIFLMPVFDKTGKELSAANKMLSITKNYSIKGFNKLKVDQKYSTVYANFLAMYQDCEDIIEHNLSVFFGKGSSICFDSEPDSTYGRYQNSVHQLLYNGSSKYNVSIKNPITSSSGSAYTDVQTIDRSKETLEENPESSLKVFYEFCLKTSILEKLVLSDLSSLKPLPIKLSAKPSLATTYQYKLLKLFLYGLGLIERANPKMLADDIIKDVFTYQSTRCHSNYLTTQFIPIRFRLRKDRAFGILSKYQDSTLISRPLEPTERIKAKTTKSSSVLTNKQLAQALGAPDEQSIEKLYEKFSKFASDTDLDLTQEDFNKSIDNL